MIEDLFDKRFGYESIDLYLNDQIVPFEYIQHFISKIEMDSNLMVCGIRCIMIAEDGLFKYTIAKTVQEFGPDDTIRIIIKDKDNNTIDRRFNFVKATDMGFDHAQGNQYIIEYIDCYTFITVNSEYTKYITAHGYKGTPLNIVKSALTDAFVPIVEINKTRKEKSIELDLKRFKSNMPASKETTDRFSMDKTIEKNIKEFADLNNIIIFQDFQKIHIWQHISVDQLTQINDQDGTELFSEESHQLYANHICNKVKMPSGTDTLSRINFKAYKNIDGIHHEMQQLDFDSFLPMITMNNNADTYRNLRQSLDTSSSSKRDTLEFLVRRSFVKYISNNTLIIFVRPFFKNINVGTKVSVRIHNNTEFQGDQMEGDLEYNGNWLITQSTVCTIGQHLICRLVLRRFDNQKRTETSMNKTNSQFDNNTAFSLNKPVNAPSNKLNETSRANLDRDLKKDVESRVSKTGVNANSNNTQRKTWTEKPSEMKTEPAIYRVKENTKTLVSEYEEKRKTYLEAKKEILLQAQRIKNGIDAVKNIKDLAKNIRSVDDVLNLADNIDNFTNDVIDGFTKNDN